MKRMVNMLRGNAAVLLVAGALYLFAMACSQSPTAPTAAEEKSGGRAYATAKPDTIPPP